MWLLTTQYSTLISSFITVFIITWTYLGSQQQLWHRSKLALKQSTVLQVIYNTIIQEYKWIFVSELSTLGEVRNWQNKLAPQTSWHLFKLPHVSLRPCFSMLISSATKLVQHLSVLSYQCVVWKDQTHLHSQLKARVKFSSAKVQDSTVTHWANYPLKYLKIFL